MTKKKKISASKIQTLYMDYVIEFKSKPESVAYFTEKYHFLENEFHNYFSSFLDLEQDIYATLFNNALAILELTPEYATYTKKEKLLSLYYTFFENLSLNQEFVKISLKGIENQLKAFTIFSKVKNSLFKFIDDLELETFNLNVDSIENIQKKTIKESSWIQLLLTIKFWLNDTSTAFEKTDIFIEKSVNTSFELMNSKSLTNIIDLVKFLYNEKMK